MCLVLAPATCSSRKGPFPSVCHLSRTISSASNLTPFLQRSVPVLFMACASEWLLHARDVLHQPLYIHPDPHHVLGVRAVDPQALLCPLVCNHHFYQWENVRREGRLFIPQDAKSTPGLQALMDNHVLNREAGEHMVQGKPWVRGLSTFPSPLSLAAVPSAN